jgi:Winged helix-turn helix
MNSQLALTLSASASSNTVFINARCAVRVQEDQRVIIVSGLPVHHYQGDDAVAEAYAMVLLVESGFAQQTEVARAFGISERTVRRYQQRYTQQGMVGLGHTEGWRRGRRRVTGKRLRSIERLKSEGLGKKRPARTAFDTPIPLT